MHIEILRLQNFKGLTTELRCGKLNLLVGPNRVGKTAHGQAIQFLMRGHTDLGATLEATQQLGGPAGCFVEATLDDGFTWARMIERKGRTGQLSSHVQIQGQEQLPAGRAHGVVLQHVGDFAPMLDIGAFLGLSPEKRREFVLSLCATAENPEPEAVWLGIVTEFCKRRLGEATIAAKIDADGICSLARLVALLGEAEHRALAKIEGHITAALVGDTAGPHLDGQPTRKRPTSEAIAAALDKAKEWANASKARATSASQAADVLAERRRALQTSADTADVLRDNLVGLEARRDELNVAIGRQEGSDSSRQDIERRLCDAREAHRTACATETAVRSVDLLNAQITETEETARATASMVEALAAVTEDAVAEADALWKHADNASCEQHEKCEAFQRELGQIRFELKVIADNPWRTANTLMDAILEERPNVICEPWDTLAMLIKTQASVSQVEPLRQRRAQAQDRYDAACQLASRADGKTATRLAELGVQRESLENKRQQEREYALAVDTANALTTERDQLTQRRSDAAAAARAKLDEATGLEKALRDLDAETGAGVSLDTLRMDLQVTSGRMATVQDKIDAKLDEARMFAEMNRCVVSAESERVMHDVAKGVADAIRVLRERLMATLVRPLVERIDRFIQVYSATERAYCSLVNDKGRPVFDLGVVLDDGATKVALPAMSGGQQCMFCTALLFALVDLAAPPLKVLIIELDRADSETFMRIGDAIDANETWLGDVQVFLLSHTYPRKAWDGWAVHDLQTGQSSGAGVELSGVTR